jgi:hypothetical protein
MKIKTIILLFLSLIISINSISQKKTIANSTVSNGYTLTISTKNLKNEKLIMYMVYGVNIQQVITDSATIKSNDQKIIFKKNQKMLGVIYYLKLASQNTAIELAIDNNSTIDLTLENKNIATINCTKNNLNKEFINYQLQSNSIDNDKKIAIRKALMLKYPTSILNLYFKVENLIMEKKPENYDDQIKYRNIFISRFDKNDSRIYLLPNIYRLLYSYITILPINNENYIKNIDLILTGIPCNSKNYPVYIRWFLSNFNYYGTKNLENTFTYLFKKYIDNDKCKNFSDKEIAVYSNKFETIKKVPFNSVIPEITLLDKQNKEYNLATIYPEFDYTFIAFFSPNCSHCKETIPQVNVFFNQIKAKHPNLKVQTIAIINDTDESKWNEFITHSKIENWMNMKPNDEKRKYQEDFNAYSNPDFFLVNKTGNVILKDYNPMALEEIFNSK